MLFKETVKLPLSMDQLQEVLALKGEGGSEVTVKQDIMAEVSYKDSTLKGANFINYVSNLKLSINLVKEDNSKEDRFELMRAYLTSRMMSEISVLNLESITMLMKRKLSNIETVDGETYFTNAEREEFMEEYKEVLEKYELFLESILVGLPFCLKEYASTIGKELIDSGAVEAVNDPAFISSNIVSIIIEPDFLENYLSLPLKNKSLKFFDSQWFEPVFNGFSLISIMTQHTSFFPFMQHLLEGELKKEDIDKLKKEVLDSGEAA